MIREQHLKDNIKIPTIIVEGKEYSTNSFMFGSKGVGKKIIFELSVKKSKKFLRLNKRKIKIFISKLDIEKKYITIPLYKFLNFKFHKNYINMNIKIARNYNLVIGFTTSII